MNEAGGDHYIVRYMGPTPEWGGMPEQAKGLVSFHVLKDAANLVGNDANQWLIRASNANAVVGATIKP